MKRPTFVPGWALNALALGTLACVCSSLGDLTRFDGTGSGAPAQAPATAIQPNQSYNQTMLENYEEYPGGCQYYSLPVSAGYSQLDIQMTGMSTDLDLYVQYEDPNFSSEAESDSDSWYSRESDSADEQVSISSPQAGTYYIEICSFEGEASPYTLSTTLQ